MSKYPGKAFIDYKPIKIKIVEKKLPKWIRLRRQNICNVKYGPTIDKM